MFQYLFLFFYCLNNFKLVLNGAFEAYRHITEIKAANAEIILHATMALNGGDMVNMTMESAAILTKAGIAVSLETGFEAYIPKTRILLFDAAQAIVFGLSFKNNPFKPCHFIGHCQ